MIIHEQEVVLMLLCETVDFTVEQDADYAKFNPGCIQIRDKRDYTKVLFITPVVDGGIRVVSGEKLEVSSWGGDCGPNVVFK
jgi:hypothetical protein